MAGSPLATSCTALYDARDDVQTFLCKRKNLIPLLYYRYVFCYLCILGYLRDHRQCPVTCIPSTEQQLIKLFTQQTA